MGVLQHVESGNAAKIGSIQTLRAFSAIAVLLAHSNYGNLRGEHGVHIFFVISGYLAARTCTKPAPTAIELYAKRIKRIVPSYLVVIFATLFFSRFSSLNVDERATLLVNSLLSSIFIDPLYTDRYYFSSLGHLWTVSIEMQFYLIAPFLYFWLFRFDTMKRIGILVLLIIVSLTLHCWILPFTTSYTFLFARIFEFFIGSMAFYIEKPLLEKLNSSRNPLFTRQAWNTVSILSYAICFMYCYLAEEKSVNFHKIFNQILYYSIQFDILIVNFSAAAIIMCPPNPKWLGCRLTNLIADISYALYLVHFPIFHCFYSGMLHFPSFFVFLFALFLSFMVAIIFRRSVEEYFIHASNRQSFLFIAMMYLLTGMLILYDLNNGVYLRMSRETGSFLFEG